MGEVFRARDTKLNRDVALKVLPDLFANDPDRLARFQREAEVLASLNHPNIAAIYGLEEEGGTRALVLELVEGPTLADRIAEGAIPLDEALDIVRQIADALEAAHEAGIIHRDLKPANIKIREDGTVKVLDFGLAKALGDDKQGDPSESPTLTTAATRAGAIMGTAAYMSPEQAKGKPVDKRADIWAFGAVLFEMLTGKRPFDGEDISETLAFVLTKEPDWSALSGDIAPSLRAYLKRCLQKDPRQRVRDVGDLRLAMAGAFDTGLEASESVAVAPRTLPWAAAVVAASMLTGLGVRSMTRSVPPEVTRIAYDLPASHQLRNLGRAVLAASPDGRRFVYNTADGLYLRAMDQLDARVLLGTEEALGTLSIPFFSPDGRSVAFFQGGNLKRLALSGGTPVVVCSVFQPSAAHWAPDDTIFFAQAGGILRVPANGGTLELVIPDADGELLDAPQLLSDGDSLLFTARAAGARSWDNAQIVVQSLSSGERTVLLEGGSDARYVPSGHLVYALDDGLFAVAFDAKNLSVASGPVSMVQGVVRADSTRAVSANYAVSDDGTLFYLAGEQGSYGPLIWVDRTGKADVIETILPNEFSTPRLSPDGERVLVVADGDVRIYDLTSGRESRLTTDGAAGSYAGWAPSGAEVAYTANRGTDGQQIWMQPADGSGTAWQLTALGGRVHFDSWAPDGRTLSAHHHSGGTVNLLIVPFDGAGGEPETWLEREHIDGYAVFSPNGRDVAFVSNQTGSREIYIRPFPGPGGQMTVSVGGGQEPAWTPTGELFYRRPRDWAMMVVEVSTDPVLAVGAPDQLFLGLDAGTGRGASARYAVTADGQRFLMSAALLASGEASSGVGAGPKVVVVLNWVEELKERVPVN